MPLKSLKDKIQEAAIKLFKSIGFDGIWINDIANEAGVSEGLIYKHYVSKSALKKWIIHH